MTNPPDPLAELGDQLAEVLKLRRDSSHADRYQTTWGSKTALGVGATVLALVTAYQRQQTEADMADNPPPESASR